MENLPTEKLVPAPDQSQAPARNPTKWYFKTNFLVITFLMVGPLVLPLIWFHPAFSQKKKIVLSAIIAAVSYLLGIALLKSLQSIEAYYSLINF